ncbi:hypothetical protein ARTHRO9AX_70087 [Arthrobacter sp. 9AX]|nr:hypothetical protein ARTHRO9AX_70087 [Arthrobacter sp. 9AX]
MMAICDTRKVANSGFPMVAGKKAQMRNAVSKVVTKSGIWLNTTRSVSVYSWKGRRKNLSFPVDQATGSVIARKLAGRGVQGHKSRISAASYILLTSAAEGAL